MLADPPSMPILDLIFQKGTESRATEAFRRKTSSVRDQATQ